MKILLLLILSISLSAQKLEPSLILEAKDAIDNGLSYLLANQNQDNSWGKYGGNPALTSLVITAFASDRDINKTNKQIITKSAKYVANFAQKNGAIYDLEKPRYINYTTSLGLVALFLVDQEKYSQIGINARRFLKSSQFTNTYNYGGIGYGSDKTKPDLSNTQFALEALHITQSLEREVADINDITDTKLCWERARVFLSRCQKITSNDMEWVKKNKHQEDNGGAIYSPTVSKVESKDGSLRTYGSMTYALLKSMIYADLKEKDIRVSSILSWISNNYTLDENPNVGQQGYYYYLNMFAKALHVSQQEYIATKDGNLHNWRQDIIKKLLSLQKGDGFWQNSEGRWQESNPLLVTAYSIITLRYALGKYN